MRCLRAARALTAHRPAARPLCGLRRRRHRPGPGRSGAQRPHNRRPGEHSLPAGTGARARLGPGNEVPGPVGAAAGSHLESATQCGCVCARTAPPDPAPQERSVESPTRQCAPPGARRTSGIHGPGKPQRAPRSPFPPGPSVAAAACAPGRRALSPGCWGDRGFGPGRTRSLGARPASPTAHRAGGGSPEAAASRRTAARPPCPLVVSQQNARRAPDAAVSWNREAYRASRPRPPAPGCGWWATEAQRVPGGSSPEWLGPPGAPFAASGLAAACPGGKTAGLTLELDPSNLERAPCRPGPLQVRVGGSRGPPSTWGGIYAQSPLFWLLRVPHSRSHACAFEPRDWVCSFVFIQ